MQVQFSSVAQSCPTLCYPMNRSTPGLPVHHHPWVHSDSCPSSPWCHPVISSSVVPFSSCPQSLPASKSSPMSQLSESEVAQSCPTLCDPWTVAQAPPSMGFSRQEYWSGLPFPSPLLRYSWFKCFRCMARWFSYTYIGFQILFHYRLLQNTDYSSLCHQVKLCCLLHIYSFLFHILNAVIYKVVTEYQGLWVTIKIICSHECLGSLL